MVPWLPTTGGQDERHACAFSDLLAESATPEELRRHGIYAKVAVPLKGGALRFVGMALLAKEVAASAGNRVRRSGWDTRAGLWQWCAWVCGGRSSVADASDDGQLLLVSNGGKQVVVLPSERLRTVELSSVLSARS